jgi:hypothetical protein
VGGVFDQRALGFLESLGDATAGLRHGKLGGVQLLLAGHSPDPGGFRRGRGGLFLLVSGGARHRSSLLARSSNRVDAFSRVALAIFALAFLPGALVE